MDLGRRSSFRHTSSLFGSVLVRLGTMWSTTPEVLEQAFSDMTGPLHTEAYVIRESANIDWLPYFVNGTVDRFDYSFLTAYQAATTKEERDSILCTFKDQVHLTFVHVIRRIPLVEVAKKILVMLDDMFWEDMNRIDLFKPSDSEPWKNFLDLLSCGNIFVKHMSSRVISKLISYDPKPSHADFFMTWLKQGLKEDNEYIQSIGRCLQRVLLVDAYRIDFMARNGVYSIIKLLSGNIKQQTQYQLCFCLWLTTFNSTLASKMNRFSVIPVLADTLAQCPNENVKLPRLIVATFRNLLEKPAEDTVQKHNSLIMKQCKACKYLDMLETRALLLNDPEFVEDFEIVESILTKNLTEMTLFDPYLVEVKSEFLEWSPVHTSLTFWQKYAYRLNDNRHELLKILLNLLKTSPNHIVLSVAAHDLGQYLKFYPRGRSIIEKLGGKKILMDLLFHKNPCVKYNILKTLQLLMLKSSHLLDTDSIKSEKENIWI